jgi:hypothetical protein
VEGAGPRTPKNPVLFGAANAAAANYVVHVRTKVSTKTRPASGDVDPEISSTSTEAGGGRALRQVRRHVDHQRRRGAVPY